MENDDEERLVPNDPESEAHLDALTALITEELDARIAVGDAPHTPEGRAELSMLIADVVLDHYIVRARTEPRYRMPAPR